MSTLRRRDHVAHLKHSALLERVQRDPRHEGPEELLLLEERPVVQDLTETPQVGQGGLRRGLQVEVPLRDLGERLDAVLQLSQAALEREPIGRERSRLFISSSVSSPIESY